MNRSRYWADHFSLLELLKQQNFDLKQRSYPGVTLTRAHFLSKRTRLVSNRIIQREKSPLDSDGVPLSRIITQPEATTGLDQKGNSVLCALLKTVDNCFNEVPLEAFVSELRTAGTEIRMPDRQCGRALGITARRGFRLKVMTPLKHGANIHTTDVNGKGILSQTRRKLWEARNK